MVYSMTAFARAQSEQDGLLLVWELRSVNHRYLETQFRIPETLRAIEHPLREVLRKRLQRGKVDCTLRVEPIVEHQDLELNRPLLLQLLALIEQVRRDAPEVGHPNPMDLLRWPGVLGDTTAVDHERLRPALTALFDEAVSQLLSHRGREGELLSEAIAQRLSTIEALVNAVRQHADTLTTRLQARLRERAANLQVELDPERLEQEVALLAQRADVAEELDRLDIHVAEARTNLAKPGPHGRRLDFLTQELNREANTLAAKSSIPETSQLAVDLKVAIEQIREQVQNIE